MLNAPSTRRYRARTAVEADGIFGHPTRALDRALAATMLVKLDELQRMRLGRIRSQAGRMGRKPFGQDIGVPSSGQPPAAPLHSVSLSARGNASSAQ